MVTYLTKFISNFSNITSPHRELLKFDVHWHWTQQHSDTVNIIKSKLTTAPVLHYFDPPKPVTTSTDASSYRIGSVLLQQGQPVAYASATLTAAQQKYAQIKKKVVVGLHRWCWLEPCG